MTSDASIASAAESEFERGSHHNADVSECLLRSGRPDHERTLDDRGSLLLNEGPVDISSTKTEFNPLQPFSRSLSRDRGSIGYGFSVIMEVSEPGIVENITVHKVSNEGPAATAGVMQGDMIVLINGTPTAGLQHEAAIKLLDDKSLHLGFIRPVFGEQGGTMAPISDSDQKRLGTVTDSSCVDDPCALDERVPSSHTATHMDTRQDHTLDYTPIRAGEKKRSIARRFLQLDKVTLPGKRSSPNATWKHFLGLDSMPGVIHEILHPKVGRKQAAKSRVAACKSKANELKKLITTRKAKGQETNHLESDLSSVHSDYIKTDLQHQLDKWSFSTIHGDLQDKVMETHAVLLRCTDNGFGIHLIACNDTPYLRVSEIVPHSAAHKSGLIRIGDHLLRINGKDMLNVLPKNALRELKQNEVVALVLGRDVSPITPELVGGVIKNIRPSMIPVPTRPPLLSQLSKLEAEICGRELVLGHINYGLESDVIRYEYERLGRHVKMLRGMLSDHDKTQRLQQDQRSEIELMRVQMREVNRHAAERAAKEQAADVAIIKMLQTKLETLEHERATDLANINELGENVKILEQQLVQKEKDLMSALEENCRLAAVLRQRERGIVRMNDL